MYKELVIFQDRPIRDRVYEILRKDICRGEIKDGSKIPEEEIAKRLKVSRTPIREALRKLEMDGLVEYIPRRGVVVKPLDRKEIIEIYQIRMALEIVAVYYIHQNITDQEIKQLEKCQQEIEDLFNEEELQPLFDQYDIFHRRLIESSRSQRITSILCSHYDYLQRLRAVTHNKESRKKEAAVEHRKIVEALKRKDLSMLKEAVLSHTRASLNAYLLSEDGVDLDAMIPQFF